MLKLNDNRVSAAVKSYIVSCLDTDYTEDLKDRLKAVIEEFSSWYGPYEKRRIPNRQAAFTDWLMGLPSCLSADYTYYAQRQLLKNWLHETDQEANKYKDEEVTRLFYALIYREFVALCRENKIRTKEVA